MRVRGQGTAAHGQVPSTYCFLCALQECLLMFLNSWMSIKRRGIVCDTVRWCDMKMLCIIHFAGILSFWLFLVASFEWQCQSSEVPAQVVWPQIFGTSQIFATWSKKVCWPYNLRGMTYIPDSVVPFPIIPSFHFPTSMVYQRQDGGDVCS